MSISSDRITSHAEFHVSFVYAALTIALTVGFGYAAVLAFLIGFDLPLGDWLVSAIQAHGHAQLYGWTGLFIVGVSLHFLLPESLLWRFPSVSWVSTYTFGLSGALGWTALAIITWNLLATCLPSPSSQAERGGRNGARNEC